MTASPAKDALQEGAGGAPQIETGPDSLHDAIEHTTKLIL